MYVLETTNPDGTPRALPLEKLPALAGRAGGAEVYLPEASVSREHARFFLREGRLHVADLNARNGTFVNGKRVTLAPLAPGDEIRLGRVRLRLVEAGDEGKGSPAAAAAPPAEARGAPSPPSGGAGAGATASRRPERDAPPPPRPAPAQAPPAGGALSDPGEIRVRERVLSFKAREGKERRSILAHDFSQYGGAARLLLLLLFLALAAGTFLLFRWIGSRVVSEEGMGLEPPPAYEEPPPGK